ncbi:MAG: biotin--[acetyl-CoA-carboxylase] ligase [Acidobacteria bacterium]|nr:MAG: biotin--[acetyl-CoA-carboxylase] ligase [Acidobacteriota bacterium]
MKITRFDYDSIDSTNAEARRFWGRPETRRPGREAQGEERRAWVFVAKEQTAGRGRLGRSWASPPGGLWFTVLWPLAASVASAQAAPLVVGLAVLRAIENHCSGPCRIKWPNDILIRARKICGILCELESQSDTPALVIGIGINANFHSSDLPVGVSYPGTTLLDETGIQTDLHRLLRETLDGLSQTLLGFEREGLTPFLGLINARLAWVGARVTVCGSEAGEVTGLLRGVDERGRLVIDRDGRLLALLTGEVRKSVLED